MSKNPLLKMADIEIKKSPSSSLKIRKLKYAKIGYNLKNKNVKKTYQNCNEINVIKKKFKLHLKTCRRYFS